MIEDIRLSERIKMFCWDLFICPIIRTYRSFNKDDSGKMAKNISNIFLTLFFISVVLLYLEKYKILTNLPIFTNIYTSIFLFVSFVIFNLMSKWQNREYIAKWREYKNIPNQQEIHRIKLNAQKENPSDENK